jgi:hypothetical protein
LDLNPSRAVLTIVNWLFVLLGSGAIIYGIYLALEIASRKAGA